MNKKTKVLILLSIVISLVLIVTTMTFITRNITTNNVITFGNIKMKLMQTTLDENNQEKEVYNDDVFNITYTPEITRIIKIENLGKQDFFARISLNFIRVDENDNIYDANDLVLYNVNADDWIYENGWYYYKNIVKQEEITSNFTTQINFDVNKIVANFPDDKIKLDIKAEAVQAKNNENNVLEVEGWPLS